MFSYCSNSGDFRYGNPGMSASDSGIKCADGFPFFIIVMIIRIVWMRLWKSGRR